ncbi:MAG TPA: hypothetical protein VL985_15670 [Stellaceae bacterium]|nr:hypothetical protein [Stellaceae bacterium]
MEWWILAGVIIALCGGGVAVRLHKGRRGPREKETDSIYPLW